MDTPPTISLVPPSMVSPTKSSRKRSKSKTEKVPAALAKRTPGTLAHAIKSIKGGNSTIRMYLELRVHTDPRLKKILDHFDALPPRQQTVSTIWDNLCDQFQISAGEFFGNIARAAIDHNRNMAQIVIATQAPDLAASIMKHGRNSKNYRHAELGARISGLVEEKSGVTINNQQLTTVVQTERGMPRLEDTASDALSIIKEKRKLLLDSMESNVVEGELIPQDVLPEDHSG